MTCLVPAAPRWFATCAAQESDVGAKTRAEAVKGELQTINPQCGVRLPRVICARRHTVTSPPAQCRSMLDHPPINRSVNRHVRYSNPAPPEAVARPTRLVWQVHVHKGRCTAKFVADFAAKAQGDKALIIADNSYTLEELTEINDACRAQVCAARCTLHSAATTAAFPRFRRRQ